MLSLEAKITLEINARHEAGHWVSGWVLGKSSTNIVLTVPENDKDESYCESSPHPDFSSIQEINNHLSGRIVSLLCGAKAESFDGNSFDHDRFNHLISGDNRAWPDYFIASELFRYFYHSLPIEARSSHDEEWFNIIEKAEDIVSRNLAFIWDIGRIALERADAPGQRIELLREELIAIYQKRNPQQS